MFLTGRYYYILSKSVKYKLSIKNGRFRECEIFAYFDVFIGIFYKVIEMVFTYIVFLKNLNYSSTIGMLATKKQNSCCISIIYYSQ